MSVINTLPPAPSRTDPSTFANKSDALLGALAGFVSETNTVVGEVNTNTNTASTAATTATIQAGIATTSATNATNSELAAAASAASAAAIAGAFVGTSSSSLTIGVGNKTFVTQTGEQYTVGVTLSAVSAANTANYMLGQVVSYSGTNLVLNVTLISGSGTYADWNISLTGVQGPPGTGVISQAVGFTLTGGTTSKTLTVLDTGTAVVDNASQTLTNKTLDSVVLNNGYTEEVFTITDGASVDINPANGSIQIWTLGANRTATAGSFAAGQSVLIGIDDGTTYSLTWPTIVWSKVGGSGTVPLLTATGRTWIILWKVSSTLYGSLLGSA